MKFTWKIFFSTMLLICLTFSIGGYLMISSSFQSSLEKEISLAREENKLLRFSFENASGSGIAAGASLPASFVRGLAKTVEENTGGRSRIRISDQQKTPLYSSEGIGKELQLPDGISEQVRRYSVVRSGGRQYLQMASQITVAATPIYLESFRDITSLFSDRQEKYWIYVRLMLALLALNGIATYLTAFWLTRPVQALAKTARRISDGEFHVRATVHSSDEIGLLAGEFNRMTDHVQAQMETLQDTLKRQENFIASFAHEIKTPLTSVIGYSDLLRRRKMEEEQQFMAADYIYREGKRLENLSFKLLDLIVLKNSDLPLVPLTVEPVFEDIRQALYPVVRDGSVQVLVDCEDAVILAEPDLFKTLLLNLADNARKALDGTGEIRLKGRRAEDGYRITVEDNGKGIPQEDLPMLTEAFYMVDKSRARTQGGAGLGLAICAEIVALHGGKLWFESTPGKGTKAIVLVKEAEV